MDEMQRAIRQDSKARGFDFMVIGLAALILLRIWESVSSGNALDMRPVFILMVVLAYRGFWEFFLSRQAVGGDEEQRGNTWKSWIVTIVCVLAMFAIGYILTLLF